MSGFTMNQEKFREQCADLDRLCGRALHKWGHVENKLFQIFRLASGTHNTDVAAGIFQSVIHFDLKRKITTAAIVALLKDDPLLTTWVSKTGNSGLSEKLRKTSQKRNNIAHGTYSVVGDGDKQQACIAPPFPAAYVSDSGYFNKQMTCAQVQGAETAFRHRVTELGKFQSSLSLWVQSHPEHQVPPTRSSPHPQRLLNAPET